jgi:hypothetical protein
MPTLVTKKKGERDSYLWLAGGYGRAQDAFSFVRPVKLMHEQETEPLRGVGIFGRDPIT